MRFNGAGIFLEHFKEQIDRFILLIAQQEVNPSDIVSGEAVGFFILSLLCTSAPHIPAIGGGNRQQQK